jgi:hypothetical protein
LRKPIRIDPTVSIGRQEYSVRSSDDGRLLHCKSTGVPCTCLVRRQNTLDYVQACACWHRPLPRDGDGIVDRIVDQQDDMIGLKFILLRQRRQALADALLLVANRDSNDNRAQLA